MDNVITNSLIHEEIGRSSNGRGGSTALCVVFPDKKSFYIVNLGDSNIALLKEGESLNIINKIHNLTIESERDMVTNRGGFILMKNNSYRLQGDLVLSRSFGDYVYKEFLSVEPDIYKFNIQENDKYLILATDGFWKVNSL